MSDKYEDLARSARVMAGSTGTHNWGAATGIFHATCTPYKIMEITEDFGRVTAERDALQQRLTAADERADVLEVLLRSMTESYAISLDAGYDRITALGGKCDSVQRMLADNPDYAKARAALKPAERTNTSGKAHCPHDGICHTSNETCAQAMARVAQIKPAEGGGDE